MKLLLQRLAIENFMLHRHTTVELGRAPVTLITGANGSGKTQILDALILALGHHPRRVRKATVAEMIGKFGPSATIRLTLANPAEGGRRPLVADDAALASIVDRDLFDVVATLEAESGLDYRIESEVRRRRVQRRDVRALFESVALRADNQLAFTEEGTVNVFTDQSGRNKFELLLETTGLAAYRQNILATLDTLERAAADIEPMKKKMELEKDVLVSFEKNLDLIARRDELTRRLAALEVEEPWAAVVEVESRLAEEELRLGGKRREIAEIDRQLAGLERKEEELTAARKQVAGELERRLAARRELESLRDRIEGTRAAQQEWLERLAQQDAALEEELAGERQKLVAARRDAQATLERLRKRSASAAEKAERWRRAADPLTRRLAEAGGDPWIQTMRRGLEVRAVLDEAGLAAVRGPLLAERPAGMRLADADPFAFAAPDDETLRRAHAVVRERFGDACRPVVLRIAADGAAPEIEEIDSDDAPAAIAATAGERILVHQARGEVYGPGPSIRWLDPDHLLETPGVADHDSFVAAEARAAAGRDLEARVGLVAGELLVEEQRTAIGAATIEESIVKLEARRESGRALHDETAARLGDLDGQLARAGDQLAAACGRVEEQEAELDRRRAELDESGRASARAETRRKEASALAERYAAERDATKRTAGERTARAKRTGARPALIRSPEEVAGERRQLAGSLDTLEMTRVDMETFRQQQKKVEAMQKELAGSGEHLENLRRDLEAKHRGWHKEVTRRVAVIGGAMNRLLAGIFDGVRVTVDNLLSADRAALEIRVRRRGKDWRALPLLSGGEKVLVVQALILSMHLLSDSPVHALDEFTQRLDLENKAYALEMLERVLEGAPEARGYRPQFLILCPDTLGLDLDGRAAVFHRLVLAAASLREEPSAPPGREEAAVESAS